MTDTTNTTNRQHEAPADEPVSGPTADEGTADTVDQPAPADQETENFPREYVTKLRDEAAKYRQKAADRDDLAQRLHTALVAATGRLADPTDLTFDEAYLTDPDALAAAIDGLLAAKPHLASRKPSGDVGQGATLNGTDTDLAGLLRRNAS